ncbi:Uncharacterized protein Fot_27240 [Forsythia ovata]|uniref:Uncharacterized protein n=1 Tax=Forsythia ovata TaxID=205694 RepID=A0ABD1UE58_9LAMI
MEMQNRRADEDIISSQSSSKSLIFQANEDIRSSSGSNSQDEDQISGCNLRSLTSGESCQHRVRSVMTGTKTFSIDGQNRRANEDVISSQSSSKSLIFQANEDITSSSGSNSEAEGQISGLLQASRCSKSTKINIVSMCIGGTLKSFISKSIHSISHIKKLTKTFTNIMRQNRRADEDVISSQSYSKFLIFQANEDIRSSSGSSSHAEDQITRCNLRPKIK